MPRSGARSIAPVLTPRQPARVAVALLAAVLLLLTLGGIRVQLAGAQGTPVADSTTDAPRHNFQSPSPTPTAMR